MLALCVSVYGYVSVSRVGADDSPLIVSSDVSSTTGGINPLSPVEMSMLAKIQSITLDGSIFSDQIFATSLQDWTVDLPQISAGKTNPFLPLSGLVVAPANPKSTKNSTSVKTH